MARTNKKTTIDYVRRNTENVEPKRVYHTRVMRD